MRKYRVRYQYRADTQDLGVVEAVNADQPCGEYLRNDILAAEELRDVSTGLRQ